MPDLVLLTATLILFLRLNKVRRFWRLPLQKGADHFMSIRVQPGFYQRDGAQLIKRYRRALLIAVLLDSPLIVWLAVKQRYDFLLVEQFVMMIVGAVVYNLIIVHFSYQAQTISGIDQVSQPTTLQLSMSTRRLSDQTNWIAEGIVIAGMLAAIVMILRAYLSSPHDAEDYRAMLRGGLMLSAWIIYLQIGLLLLKIVFVRWRMPLPAKRTDEFRQWRAVWLRYHLRILDLIRMLAAIVLCSGAWIKLKWLGWTNDAVVAACIIWIPSFAVFLTLAVREARRLAAAQRELKPTEMIDEFPRRPVPQGRFLAGGLLYFNRDNPVVIVRSINGVAINIAHPSAYVWLAYFVGLAVLTAWLAS